MRINLRIISISLKFILSLFILYMIIQLILFVVKIRLISVINLNLFSFWLSLLILSVSYLLKSNVVLYLPTNFLKRIFFYKKVISFLILVLGIILLFFSIFIEPASKIAFIEWSNLSPTLIIISIIYLLIIFYCPAYIFYEFFLKKTGFSATEKLAIYPIISTLMLLPTAFVKEILLEKIILFIVFGGCLILLLRKYYSSSFSLRSIKVNLSTVLAIIAITGFNLFITISALGEEKIFLRGDMWGEAHRVAFLKKYGFRAYLSSPVEVYPPLFSLLWLALLNLLPLPFINGLIIIALFNHIFSLIAFYILAKTLLKNSTHALLSVILWSTLSGFSWTYLILNPLNTPLFGKRLLTYILHNISFRFGKYSGTIVSPIYADGHSLTRLWSLGLYFICVTALIKACLKQRDSKKYLVIVLITLFQILMGHVTEIPLIALVMITLILTKGKISYPFLRSIFLGTSVLSIISVIFIYDFNWPLIMAIFSLPMAISFSLIILNIYYFICKYSFIKNIFKTLSKILRRVLSIILLYIYGLMFIAFFNFNVAINWPIFTLWFSPAIEWGFLGLISIPTLALILWNKKISDNLIFIIILFTLQLFFVICLNYVNLTFSWIYTPYPIEPLFFLPLLALIASFLFIMLRRYKIIIKFKKQRAIKIYKEVFLVPLIISILLFGSLDHIISASFWKVNNGWWLGKVLNPTREDYELINFLYSHSSIFPYEFIVTFYDWHDPSSYVVYPSGMSVLSKPLIEIISTTDDPAEIYILQHCLPINYILVSRGRIPNKYSYLTYSINHTKPLFSNRKYAIYPISQSNLSCIDRVSILQDFITAEMILLNGNLTLIDKSGDKFIFKNIRGKIYPIGKGDILIDLLINNNITSIIMNNPTIKFMGNLTLIEMKSTWGYFREIRCNAGKLIILGEVSFKIFSTVKRRIYMKSFVYTGKYYAYPLPTYLCKVHAKEQIKKYLKANSVTPIDVLSTFQGKIWTLIFLFFVIFLMINKIKKNGKKSLNFDHNC